MQLYPLEQWCLTAYSFGRLNMETEAMKIDEQLRRIAKLKKQIKELLQAETYRQEGECLIIDFKKWRSLNDR